MNKIAKEVWVEALRSGEFKQGRTVLKDKGKYCCLGVLKEIYPNLTTTRNNTKHRATGFDDNALYLLDLNYTAQCDLMKLNDDDGYSFNEIADHIEQNL